MENKDQDNQNNLDGMVYHPALKLSVHPDPFHLTNLLDIESLRSLMEARYRATGIALGISDLEGNFLVSSHWQKVCQMHRGHPETARRCVESDIYINTHLDQQPYASYRCANGLQDLAAPILVEGRHVGTVFLGQFLYEDEGVDVDAFRRRARQFGFDEEAYLKALEQVPRYNRAQVEVIMDYNIQIINMLARQGLQNLKLRQEMEERRKAEQALKEKSDELEYFFDVNLDLLCIADTSGHFLRVNGEWENLLGYRREDLDGKLFLDFIHPADLPGTMEAMRTLSGQQEVLNFINRYRCKDGSYRWIEWRSRPVGDLIYAAARDITQHKEIQDRLLQARQYLALALQVTNSSTFEDNFLTGSMITSPALYEHLGYSLEEIPTTMQQMESMVHPDDFAAAIDAMHRHNRGEAPIYYAEFRLRAKSGEWVWCNGAGKVIEVDEKGEPVRLFGVSTDITQQKRMEEALRDSEERFRLFMKYFPGLAYIKDYETRTLFANSGFLPLLGIDPRAILGMKNDDMFPPDFAAPMTAMDRHVLDSGETSTMEEHFADRSWFTTKFSIPRPGQPPLLGGLTLDITNLKRAEEKVRVLNQELEERVRQRTSQLQASNRELQSFAYTVSHDLRAPLRSLNGFSEALLQEYSSQLDDTARDYLQRIRRATNQMGELIDALLLLSRVTRSDLNLQDMDISGVAQQVAQKLSASQRQRKVVWKIVSGLHAQVDPDLMRTVINNLLHNAWKFTSQNPCAEIEVGSLEHNGKTIFFVRDNGAGFEMKYVDKMFGPFQRLHAVTDFEGVGMGLAIARRIIERHGGQIWAEGVEGKGATFYFSL